VYMRVLTINVGFNPLLYRSTSTFPDNSFVAYAIQWSKSTQGQLQFEFGLVVEDGSYRVRAGVFIAA